MNKELRVETLQETKLIGKRSFMSFSQNKTKELWQGFMPQKGNIKNTTDSDLYSVEVFDIDFFKIFNPANLFEKWAAVKVKNFDSVPEGMETLTIPKGLYAVFLYKGKASDASPIYEYIFNTWLPDSDYHLDNRPHFALMGKKYRNEDPESEEELWIPICGDIR